MSVAVRPSVKTSHGRCTQCPVQPGTGGAQQLAPGVYFTQGGAGEHRRLVYTLPCDVCCPEGLAPGTAMPGPLHQHSPPPRSLKHPPAEARRVAQVPNPMLHPGYALPLVRPNSSAGIARGISQDLWHFPSAWWLPWHSSREQATQPAAWVWVPRGPGSPASHLEAPGRPQSMPPAGCTPSKHRRICPGCLHAQPRAPVTNTIGGPTCLLPRSPRTRQSAWSRLFTVTTLLRQTTEQGWTQPEATCPGNLADHLLCSPNYSLWSCG